MTPVFANPKLTYSLKAVILLIFSIFITKVLWSTVSINELVQTFKPNSIFTYLQLGIINFSTLALGHVMFIMSLFMFGSKFDFVMKQIIAFAIAETITLWLGVYNVLNISNYVIQTIIPLTTFYIACENLYAQKLKNPRVLSVFLLGLLHGVALSSTLHETGLVEKFNLPTLSMYTLGINAAIGMLAMLLYILFIKLSSTFRLNNKLVLNILSAIIAIAAGAFAIKQVLLQN